MSSTEQKLQAILDSKNAIKQALAAKGVVISNTDAFSTYASKIDSLQVSEITINPGGDTGGEGSGTAALEYVLAEAGYYPTINALTAAGIMIVYNNDFYILKDQQSTIIPTSYETLVSNGSILVQEEV